MKSPDHYIASYSEIELSNGGREALAQTMCIAQHGQDTSVNNIPKQWIEARGCERFSNPDMMDRVPFAFSREWRDRSADHGR
jgi:hypothetical protein